MAVSGPGGPDELLARAAAAARSQVDGAPAVRRRVLSAAGRVHRTGRRVRVDRPGGPVWVSERVADAAVARAVVGIGMVPLAASLSLDGDRAVAATVVVGVVYGAAIRGSAGAAQTARAACSAALGAVLGAAGGHLAVRVVVGDVVLPVELGPLGRTGAPAGAARHPGPEQERTTRGSVGRC